MNHRLIVLLVLLSFFTVSCQQANKTRTIKLAHGLSPDHSVHKAMEYMAKRVEEKSEGKLKLQIYHSEQLGAESECLELLQIGSLGITKVSASAMESFAPGYKVLGLPYVFRDKEHMYKVEDGEIGKQILKDGEKAWLRGLCFYDAGSRSFYTKNRPIHTPSDLNGLKIRVMKSITANKMVDALGGAPVPISFGELYTALQQGVVDGAENNPPSFYLSKHYEICKYYSLDEHTSVPDVLVVSTIIWNNLSDQEKTWLQEAAEESVPVQRKLWTESEAESLAAIKEAGVEIIYPDKAQFAEDVTGLYADFKVNNPKLYTLVEKIDEIK